MKAYLFWYVMDEYSVTEYVYIIAYSVKQARYLWIKNGYTKMYDYCISPIDEIDASNFIKRHEVGEILGQDAVI